ncbi:aspartate--tRNA(Asn) ligase [Bdellovibrio sp. HCB337]|uniref:aspartate--tRNA(Asn) ligase n=1 Tax=Bdellovibrio sp. HCB337 TaxID=3394358 RepID=UPI0039A5426B
MHQKRSFICELPQMKEQPIKIAGWIYHLRVLSQTTFLVVKDATGIIQCVMQTDLNSNLHLRLDDCVEVVGNLIEDPRAPNNWELHVTSIKKLSESAQMLPFNSSAVVENISPEIKIENRPLVLRSEKHGGIFKLQAKMIELFRRYLTENHFTEIVTSKIVASGTEGGTNLFQMKYFEKIAYLAQSPQFYKEQCVAGLERVFETGHVYRAEPHATSRHLTEYYSLDVEMGFISGPEEIIELERGLLNYMFEDLNRTHAKTLESFGQPVLPSMEKAPTWEFGECLERLKTSFGRTDLVDDLDGEAERQLCQLAQQEFGVPAVFVLGFPLSARPFYTAPRGEHGAAQSFDLLFRGLEITTGGQRLHRRSELESALKKKRLEPASFESHLRMFELGMPPHGGFAIGAERLTAQILGLSNVREATLYPRDRNRIAP